jgi:uncharacterized GH25 family protein
MGNAFMKKFLLLILVLLPAGILTAHEFWIQPDRFIYEAGETINLRFWIGENFEGENWKGNGQSAKLIEIRQNKIDDLLTSNLGDFEGDSLELSLHDEGTAVLIMQTQSQQCVKTIIQVGDELSASCLKPTKLPLDIIPLENPYDPELEDSLKFLVKFNGAPLKGQMVQIWHRENNHMEEMERSTDSSGIISVPLEKSGKWMLSTVNMIRTTEIPTREQSFWGSCTWGYYR